MKKLITLFKLACACCLLAPAIGCKTTQNTESLLAQAGFKTLTATTPEQQAHLKSLRAGHVSVVQRAGKIYYVFPDVARNLLYVGRQDDYENYENLRWLQNHSGERHATPTDIASDLNWGVWGGWVELWP
jgi:hypothetical protein